MRREETASDKGWSRGTASNTDRAIAAVMTSSSAAVFAVVVAMNSKHRVFLVRTCENMRNSPWFA